MKLGLRNLKAIFKMSLALHLQSNYTTRVHRNSCYAFLHVHLFCYDVSFITHTSCLSVEIATPPSRPVSLQTHLQSHHTPSSLLHIFEAVLGEHQDLSHNRWPFTQSSRFLTNHRSARSHQARLRSHSRRHTAIVWRCTYFWSRQTDSTGMTSLQKTRMLRFITSKKG